MKNKIYFILIVVLFIASNVCAQSIPTIDRSRFEISSQSAHFSAEGGAKTFNLVADKEWSIKQQPDKWVQITTFNKSIKVVAYENTASRSRATSFIITSAGREITVNLKQDGRNSIFAITPQYVEFYSTGGSQTFTVTATDSWSISKNLSTLGVLTKSGNNLTLKVNKNTSTSRLKDYFEIKSGSKILRVNISQDGITPTFKISEQSAKFTAEGGTKTFTITSTYNWSISKKPSVCGVLTKSGNNLTLSASKNTSSTKRTDYFEIKSGSKILRVDISQDGITPTFKISAQSAKFTAEGGTKTFTITSTDSWDICVASAHWVELSRSGNTLTARVGKNPDSRERTDYFKIKSGDKTIRIDISQDAPSLEVSPKSAEFSSYGGSQTFNIKSINSWRVSIGTRKWGHLHRDGNTLRLRVKKNRKTYSRSDYFTIKSGDQEVRVDISQMANYSKISRQDDGGLINMALGYEAGYSAYWDLSWSVNIFTGLRIGNYADVVQFEVGVSPGIIPNSEEGISFYLPIYASLKLSMRSGAFYTKMGGSYNQIITNDCIGPYSLRLGFGSAWKNFEYDWIYLQYNAPNYDNRHNQSELMIGMRMAWYITR